MKVVEPRRGTRARLVELADRNAAASATSRKRGDRRRRRACSRRSRERLGLPRPPRRIECFDIAHIQGTDTVASMVTFVDGVPARGLYRKFKIADVRQRRLRVDVRGADAPVPRAATVRRPGVGAARPARHRRRQGPARDGGRRAHRSRRPARRRVRASRSSASRRSASSRPAARPIASIAATSRTRSRCARTRRSCTCSRASATRRTGSRTRSTAIAARKSSLRSELDEIPGIGATRRQRLLKHFGSVRAVRSATVDELAKAPGMNRKAAEEIVRYFAESGTDEITE